MSRFKTLLIASLVSFGIGVPCSAQQPPRAETLLNAQPLVQVPAPVPGQKAAESTAVKRPAPGLGLVRIKDITSIAGHRTHHLSGSGLVSGLGGTGSSSQQTQRFARNLMQKSNIFFDPNALATKNLSVVNVSAEIPPFLKPGEKFDVRVSVFDDATSLFNGDLHATPLHGIDGRVYAMAAGPIVMGGFSAEGNAGGVQKNHVTVGMAKGQLEVELCSGEAFPASSFQLLLTNKDYETAVRIESEINQIVPGTARALNSGVVEVKFPQTFATSKINFVAFVNGLRIKPDIPARVVINQKTGTLVVGHNVRLSKVMFANSNLVITTSENAVVSQPSPLSDGQTVVVPRTQIEAHEINSRYSVLDPNPTVGDLATALNSIGVTPQDLMGILQTLKASGDLQAELIFQ